MIGAKGYVLYMCTFQSLIIDLQTIWPSIPLSSIADGACTEVKQVRYFAKFVSMHSS